MNFDLPQEIHAKLEELDRFIEREIKPLERQDDNERFFDHRREWARTDWENDGQPRPEWEALLREMRRRADAAGHLRYGLPAECEFLQKFEFVGHALAVIGKPIYLRIHIATVFCQ